MNKLIFMCRLASDVETSFTAGENAMAISRFRVAVDKKFKKKDDLNAPTADFFRITCFGKLGEFAQNYLKKGTKILLEGRIENNNYTNAEGKTVYSDQIIAESIEFAESKKVAEENSGTPAPARPDANSFMSIPEGVEDILPFE